jgi:hypothetical protein
MGNKRGRVINGNRDILKRREESRRYPCQLRPENNNFLKKNRFEHFADITLF